MVYRLCERYDRARPSVPSAEDEHTREYLAMEADTSLPG
jgi:hypothetical protein